MLISPLPSWSNAHTCWFHGYRGLNSACRHSTYRLCGNARSPLGCRPSSAGRPGAGPRLEPGLGYRWSSGSGAGSRARSPSHSTRAALQSPPRCTHRGGGMLIVGVEVTTTGSPAPQTHHAPASSSAPTSLPRGLAMVVHVAASGGAVAAPSPRARATPHAPDCGVHPLPSEALAGRRAAAATDQPTKLAIAHSRLAVREATEVCSGSSKQCRSAARP